MVQSRGVLERNVMGSVTIPSGGQYIAVSILGDQPSILMITKKYIRLSSIMSHHGLKQTEGLGPSNTSFCCSPECFGKVSK